MSHNTGITIPGTPGSEPTLLLGRFLSPDPYEIRTI